MQTSDATQPTNSTKKIYISIDHLKPGDYVLNVIQNNKVVKSIPFQRE